MTRLTRHGYQRSKERFGLRRESAEKHAQRALELGISHKEATGRLKRYLDGLFLKHMKGNNIRIFAEKVFIFDEDELITVFHLPRELKALAERHMGIKRPKYREEEAA